MNGKQTNYILLITFNKYQDIYLPVKNNLMYQTANTIKTLINNNTCHRPLHRTAHTGDIHSLKNNKISGVGIIVESNAAEALASNNKQSQ
jgi:hypothetical protein